MTEKVTRSVLVADMADFTRTVLESGVEAALGKIATMREAATLSLPTHGGRIEKLYADNVLAVFSSPEEAVRGAMCFNRALQGEVQVCVGIGHGELVRWAVDGDYYGLELNLASKLGEDTARPGEILLTHAAAGLLSAETRARCHGLTLGVAGTSVLYFRFDWM
ncbi:MAG: hypothetical protein HYV63_02485 [Candidatus Schekmanbacteria bacterium]|nr:hypothetical protein [Candidatus Schekmanbacteria bacterium]